MRQRYESVYNEKIYDEGVRDLIARGKKFAHWAANKIDELKAGLTQEKGETKDMLVTFFHMLKRKLGKQGIAQPTPEEVKAAIAQLKDVGKVALVAAVLLGPFPGDEPILIGLEMLARKVGVSLFPSALQGII